MLHMPSPIDTPNHDPFVLVDEEEEDDDEGFVLARKEEEEESEANDSFVVVAEALEDIIQKNNEEADHLKQSASIVLSLIFAYFYVLLCLVAVSAFVPSIMSNIKEAYHHSSAPARYIEFDTDMVSVYIPTAARPVHHEIGYPVALSDRKAYHEFEVPKRPDYAIRSEWTGAVEIVPVPSSHEDQTRELLTSPPKARPVAIVHSGTSYKMPLPSIASPWRTHSTGKPTGLVLSRALNNTAESTSRVVVRSSSPAPKERPTPSQEIPTVMRIPYSPTLHVPQWAQTTTTTEQHATNRSFGSLWSWRTAEPIPTRRLPTESPAPAPPKDSSWASLETVVVAIVSSSHGHFSSFMPVWTSVKDRLSVATAVVDCSATPEESICDSFNPWVPAVRLYRYGHVAADIPLRHQASELQYHIQQALDGTAVVLSSPLTHYSFRSFLDAHRAVVVAFYHPGYACCTGNGFASVWEEFTNQVQQESLAVVAATVDCSSHPSVCREQAIWQYPTIRWFSHGVNSQKDYDRKLSVKKLVKFVRRSLRDEGFSLKKNSRGSKQTSLMHRPTGTLASV